LCSSFQAGSSAWPFSRRCEIDQAGGPVAAVRDHRGLPDGILGAGQLPRLAVVAVAGQRPADGDDEPDVGVDDDLVVGRVLVVLRLLGDGVVAGGNQGAVHTEPLALLERERRAEMVDDAVSGRLRHSEHRREPAQGQVGPPERRDQQDPVFQRQAPRSALADGAAPSRRSAVISLPNCRGPSPVNGAIQDDSDAVITPATP
jgi:hypothetical protein